MPDVGLIKIGQDGNESSLDRARRSGGHMEKLGMDVILAGYNLDKEIIDQAQRGECDLQSVLTPETISAAYARISRDPDPVNILREKSRKDVLRARKSNQRIVFDMGHHSVAEHVIFNIDVLGISRLASEALEEARLCAYTEKSQRYITLDGDFVLPSEFCSAELKLFKQITASQNALYFSAFPKLLELHKNRHPLMYENEKQRDTLEGWAKEDARFALNLATETQLGFSPNARNLEYIIRKLRHHPLSEVRELSQRLFSIGSAVAPSLILLSDPEAFKAQFGWEVSDAFLRDGKDELRSVNRDIWSRLAEKDVNQDRSSESTVRLIHYTENPDVAVIAALLHSTLQPPEPYDSCLRVAGTMQKSGGHFGYINQVLKRISAYDAVFREFEHANFCFEISVSASEFAQWKRHRMMTLTKQPYDPSLGYTYPETVVEAGLKAEFGELYDRTTEVFLRLKKKDSEAAQYVLTNGHKRRLLITANLRELYHIARLRMDEHAQWEIRKTATEMIDRVAEVAPATAFLACGKSEFAERRDQFALRAGK